MVSFEMSVTAWLVDFNLVLTALLFVPWGNLQMRVFPLCLGLVSIMEAHWLSSGQFSFHVPAAAPVGHRALRGYQGGVWGSECAF